MRVLIFGGSGFLGKNVSALLKQKDIEFATVSRSNDSDYAVDIGNYDNFENIPLNVFDIVVDCASTLPGGNFLDSQYLEKIHKTNILGTQNICKWIDNQNTVKKIINCSTLAVVSKPWPIKLSEGSNTYPIGKHVLYCSSKLTQELIFKTFADTKEIHLTQIRFSALYGSMMSKNSLIWDFIQQARNQKCIDLTNGSKVSSDFLHVTDASKIILEVIKNDVKGIINGASGIETTILELAQIIKNNLSVTIEINNREENEFKNDRSVIDVDFLKEIINIKNFKDLNIGIREIIAQ